MSVRGQSTVKIAGKELTLRLTLGALADIEDELGLSIQDLPSRLAVKFDDDGNIIKMPSFRDLIAIIIALAAGGQTPISAAEIRREPFTNGTLEAVISAISASFPDDDDSAPAAEAGDLEKKVD